MNTSKRPVAVWIVAVVYLAVGVLGLGYHFRELLAMQKDSVWVETTELVAIVCAVFLLRGQNWARWVAVAWAAFHVLISVLNAYHGVVVHSVLLVVIAWLLFRGKSAEYFRGGRVEERVP
ncbi:MAG: hypothetical protein WBV28_15250 [Terracidiphilus sp.]